MQNCMECMYNMTILSARIEQKISLTIRAPINLLHVDSIMISSLSMVCVSMY